MAAEPDWIISEAAADAALAAVPEPFAVLMRHGSMSIELYAPQGSDTQKPHEQDELYLVRTGHGLFFKNGERRSFKAGDWIFVEAGLEHRFEDFSDDFSTWVIFWGPEGGEKD
jgi:mannose-6-phosphate isomerase-like protein (cupin superfamily)